MGFLDINKIITSIIISVILLTITSSQGILFAPQFQTEILNESLNEKLTIKNIGWTQAQNTMIYLGFSDQNQIRSHICPEAKSIPTGIADSFKIEFSRVSTDIDCIIIFTNEYGGMLNTVIITADSFPGYHWEQDKQVMEIFYQIWFTMILGFATIGATITSGGLLFILLYKYRLKKQQLSTLRNNEKEIEDKVRKNNYGLEQLDKQILGIQNPMDRKTILQRIYSKEIQKKRYEEKLEIIKNDIENINIDGAKIPKIKGLSINKNKFSTGDTVKIIGKVNQNKSKEPLFIQIFDPNSNLIMIMHKEIRSEKSFEITFKMDELTWKYSGEYEIRMSFSHKGKTRSKSINVQFNSIENRTIDKKTVDVTGTHFTVQYDSDESYVSNITPHVNSNSLVITFGKCHPGKFVVMLPRALIDSKIGNNDDIFLIFGDDKNISFQEIRTPTERIITLELLKGIEMIEVVGDTLPFKKNIL